MTDIEIQSLKELCHKALRKTGLSDEHVEIATDHYLENEISGKKSHGMVRVVQLVKTVQKFGTPETAPEIVKDTGHIAVIEGNMNLGPVIGKLVTDESIKRAHDHGIAFVGGSHYYGNTGSMAYYLRRLADQNLIGIMSCNSESMVAAPTGKDRLIGTNPIGLGVPSEDGNHFIADFATSAIAFGKVLVAVDKGETLPEGCIIDKDGNPSIDPSDADKNGAILPLADYRGFALGLFVEMIGMMIGGDVIHNDTNGKDGFFIIAIDPTKLSDNYAAKVTQVLNQIRNSAPAPGYCNVSVPGDRSAEIYRTTIQKGTVSVADKTLEKLEGLAS